MVVHSSQYNRDINGQRSIHEAGMPGYGNIQTFMQVHNLDLLSATEDGKGEDVHFALQMGLTTEQKNSQGMTPLMIASIYNLEEIVAMLLRFGALPDVQAQGYTALELARQDDNREVVAVFTQYNEQIEQLRSGLSEDIAAIVDAVSQNTLYIPLAKVLTNDKAGAALCEKAEKVVQGKDPDQAFFQGLKNRLLEAWLCKRPIVHLQDLVAKNPVLKEVMVEQGVPKAEVRAREGAVRVFAQNWLSGKSGVAQSVGWGPDHAGVSLFGYGQSRKTDYPGGKEYPSSKRPKR
jgi:hypothetical protein